jgi:23S rRNA (adenine2503-C2)-methyltransferase
MAKLGNDTGVNLAVSLNATDNETRSMLMPINRKYPLDRLLQTCAEYPLNKRRKITFEYILIKDVNDTAQEAARLIKILRPIKAKINLIPFNAYEGSQYQRPDEATTQNFLQILYQKKCTAVIRHSKGQDISAACGQLRARAMRAEDDL